MGNSVIKPFTKQATYSSGSESSTSDRNAIAECSDPAEHSVKNAVSNFVAIGGSREEDDHRPADSGCVSADASNSAIHETRTPKEEEELAEGTQQETDSWDYVFQTPSHPRQPVQHSSSSSSNSPPSSPRSPSPSSDLMDISDEQASTSSASSQNVRTPQQESCGIGVARYLSLNRREVLEEILDKTSSVNCCKVLEIPIPTCARRCHAKLTCNFISYIQELADWPDRFSRMTFHLSIPKKCVEALTVSHRCTIVITVNVSSSAKTCDLRDGRCPLTLRCVVTPGSGNMELANKCKVVRHTALLDAHCEDFHIKVSAKFELQEVRYTCDDEGVVTATIT